MDSQYCKALILDDEFYLGDVLVKALREVDIEAHAVVNVDAAIKKLNEETFDIIISDIYLPEKNGRDLFDYARKNLPDIPFIFMTGNPDVDTAVDFLRNGAYDYLQKPFILPELIKKMRSSIEQSRERKAERYLVRDLKDILKRRSEDFRIYQDIFNSKEDGLLILDIDGLIVRCNPGILKMTGLDSKALLNQPIEAFSHIFPGIAFEQLLQIITREEHWKKEIRAQRNNGESWTASVTFFPIRDENHAIFAYSTIISDVTSLRRVENALIDAQEAIIFGLAQLAEQRDQETGYHLERIRSYSRELTSALQKHPRYASQITDSFVDNIYRTSPLHDIGKVGIPDQILLKGDKLTQAEYELMKQHTIIGYQTLNAIRRQYGDMEFLNMGIDITYCHHERYDGKGYPRGLSGDNIPLSAQIVALADIYDALTSERIYKEAYSHELSTEMIRAERGRHIAPTLVDVFLAIEKQFDDIRKAFWKNAIAASPLNVNNAHTTWKAALPQN